MDLKQAMIDSVQNIFATFGFETAFQGEKIEHVMSSAAQVNLLIGLTGGLQGNTVVGLPKALALQIVSAMMGGMEVSALDDIAKSALSEAAIMLVGTALGSISAEMPVQPTPPTLAVGDNVFLLISRVETEKLMFQVGDGTVTISFSTD